MDGSKELMPLDRVPYIHPPPKIAECTVKAIYQQVKDDPLIARFLPDTSRPQDKTYFFKILAAILPNFFETIMNQIKETRKTQIPEEQKVEIIPSIQELLIKNTSYIGPQKKVGQFLFKGRQWNPPTRTPRDPVNLRDLF